MKKRPWPWPWLWRLLRRDVDTAWQATGYTYTTERNYDYDAALRGARKARRQTATGRHIQRSGRVTGKPAAEIWLVPRIK